MIKQEERDREERRQKCEIKVGLVWLLAAGLPAPSLYQPPNFPTQHKEVQGQDKASDSMKHGNTN